uniref:Phosphate transporter n=1 Tax=Ciona savignyi TaxID=51511 RepID=H2ZJV4_CIOSA
VWILIVGFIIAFVLAFAVGANDVANSFGTTVGANVLTLKQACVLATIFETAGAVLIGAKVGETIRKGIIDLVATLFKLPVSGTHSIVGACIGFSLVAVGSTGVNWPKLGLIVASWFISPVLSGALSVLLFLFVKYTILGKSNPLKNGLRLLPIFYAITIGINVFSIVHSGAPFITIWLRVGSVLDKHFANQPTLSLMTKPIPVIGLDKLPWWASVVMGVGVALLTGVLVLILAVPRIRRKAENAQIGNSWVCQIIVPQTILCFFYKSKHYYPQSTHADNLMEKVGELPEDRQFRVQLLSDSSSSCSEVLCILLNYDYHRNSDNYVLLSVKSSTASSGNYFQEHNLSSLLECLSHNSGIAAGLGASPLASSLSKAQWTSCESGKHGEARLQAAAVRKNSNSDSNSRQDLADTESNDVRNQIKAFHYIPFGYDMTVYFASFLSHAHPLISQDDDHEGDDGAAVRELFSPLQVLTACFASFAHGGNDVSNAIGPLIALWIVFWSGEVTQKAFTPWYLLIYGGFGICIGLWLMGKRVIETIGKNLTKVTPSRGFCIELMTAVTVLVASNVGLPVSTTHCKVGSVVSIGWLRSRAAVDWSLVRNIALAWFVTVPVSGLLSAGVMWVLMQVVL